MKNHFYWSNIETQIQRILTDELYKFDNFNKIVTGNFCLLPTPSSKEFNNFFPCILIEANNANIFYDNKVLDITTQSYNYDIYYIHPYGGKISQDVDINAQEQTKLIANVLINYRTLDSLKLDKSETEVGFIVIDSEIQGISFDNEIKQVFLNMDISASVSIIKFKVDIKTLAEIRY